ncbi:MAG: MFS transporter [Treponemataceae bacterium]|nr:MFS transporter [Treponemataceae bacterium]
MKFMQTKLKTNNYILYLYAFLSKLHFFGSLCVPFYLNRLGISYALMFTIETIFSVCIFLFEIPTGIIADKFGRKISLFLGTLLFGISHLISGTTLNIGVFIFGQIIGAIGLSLESGADKALIYENAKYQNKTPEEISAIASRFDGFGTIGMLIAFPLGSIFVASGIFNYTSSLGLVFIATGISAVFASIIILFIKEPKNILSNEKNNLETSTENKKIEHKKLLLENAKGCLYAFKNPELRKLSLDYSVISAFTFLMFWFYQSLLLENNINIALNGFVASGFNLAASILLFASGFIQKKIGTSRTRFLSAFIPGVLYILVFFFYKNIYVILIAIFGITMLRLFRNPILITQMNLKIQDENRATVLSGVSMFNRIIVAIFYPLSGMLMDKNPHLTYLIVGIVTIIFSILLSSSKQN